ncbi:DNA/RNA nuclease SfsA [Alkaliphilus hydrothermalis]|uniref:Sugar fermentation stimulation protein homolog n=1 Tax=Alkaliphilus hydrothermalis TaxID=1482730 RepID=A0ABS2NLY8_9FIRM|nr:DNA/RNA nuclease SfsA [Alkaliphilus hydrothermalis]MBM7613957.1 sugar fermentation stimulation protein A [Alkaliphilus hydrothermalis]
MRVNIEGNKITGIFQKRINRFVAEVLIDGEVCITHVPNTGRMKELLIPGEKVILRRVDEPHRKTCYDLLFAYRDDILVALDSKLPNTILEKYFKEGLIPYFSGYNQVRREVFYGKSKFDFSLDDQNGNHALIEAKCGTLVRESGLATFPDAPTDRGRKHVLELINAVEEGIRGAVFFIIQRSDGDLFTPNFHMDEKIYQAVAMAKEKGVEFYAYNCHVTPDYIQLADEISIII